MLTRARTLILLLAVGTFLLVGCRNSNQLPDVDSLQIGLVSPVFPPLVGAGTVKIQVVDAAGAPVNDLNLNIKGDMTHAGMEPELASVSAGEGGIYAVPFEWTMAGDWVVTVNAEDEAGELTQRRFNLSVDGDMPVCGVEPLADFESAPLGPQSEE